MIQRAGPTGRSCEEIGQGDAGQAQRVSISNIYVPNEYTVFLHHSDWESISSFTGALARELQDYISHKAAEKKYSLAGRPLVKFVTDIDISPGSIRVESMFSEAPPEEGNSVAELEQIEHTQRFTPVKGAALPGPAPLIFRAKLLIDTGPQHGRSFDLKKDLIVIGRAKTLRSRSSMTTVFQGTTNGPKRHPGGYNMNDLCRRTHRKKR